MSAVRDSYLPKSAPFAHQWLALEKGGNKFSFAYLMDPGTGKTKVTIDNAAWLYRRGIITGMLVTAPSDVPAQWLEEQLPLHWPAGPLRCALWQANSARARRECLELSSKPIAGRFAVLAMNHEAFATKDGRKTAKAFLSRYKTMFVLDESDAFKTPKALRTRAVIDLAPLAVVRRILTGTPADRPFELYSQFQFLDERILGFNSFIAFKHHYGVFSKEFCKYKDPKTGQMKLRPYESLQHYQRLEELYERIDKFSFRITKEECTDLPPKIYSRIHTHLSDAQRALYHSIKEQGVALMKQAEAGKPIQVKDLGLLGDEELIEALQSAPNRVTATIALVVLLRLQQCVGGFVTDDAGVVTPIDGKPTACPRIAATVEKVESILASSKGKVIIWAQFRAELEALYAAFSDTGSQSSHYTGLVHGGITGPARTAIFDDFKDQKSSLRLLIAHPKTAGVGQNFQAATSLIYYSNGYSYRERKQSEDRAHRIGQTGTVNIYDVFAKEVPVDQRHASILSDKKDLATAVMTWRAKDLEDQC